MADRIERNQGGSMGVIGVIVGAILVIAIAFFLINGDYFRSGGSSTANLDGAKTSAPAPAPGPATTGSTPAAPAAPAR